MSHFTFLTYKYPKIENDLICNEHITKLTHIIIYELAIFLRVKNTQKLNKKSYLMLIQAIKTVSQEFHPIEVRDT